jgi:hypothetical protein
MKTNLAGASPIEQFISKLKDSGIDIDSTRFQTFIIAVPKGGAVLTQAYQLDGGYRLLLADTRGWLLNPGSDDQRPRKLKLLPESEMNKSIDYVRETVLRNEEQ